MNPVVLALATIAAIAGGAAGSFAVSKLKPQQTNTGDAFDETTNALLLTPAAPYSAAAKVMRPFVERGANALAREFAPVPKRKKKKTTKSCQCHEGEMQDDTGFTSIGALPGAPEKPARYFRQCKVIKGKKVCQNFPYPKALYDKAVAEWKVKMREWEQARAFDAKIEAEKAKIAEQMRRATARKDVEALKAKLNALNSAQKLTTTPGALPKLKFGKDAMLKWYQQVAKNGVPPNMDPTSLMQALAQFGNQNGLPGFGIQQPPPGYTYPPGTSELYDPYAQPYGAPALPPGPQQPYGAPPGYAYPQQPYGAPPGLPPGYAYPQEPFAVQPDFVPEYYVPQVQDFAWPPGFGPQTYPGANYDPFSLESGAPGPELMELPGDLDGMFGVEGTHDDAGNADSACCVSCGIGGPCDSGTCG